jgi:peptidoglycan DL-endopeptidase LytE
MKRQILAFSGLFVLLLLLSIFSSNALAIQYKVKNGDTLSSISKKFGVSVNEIKQTNNIQQSRLKKNQVLSISKNQPAKKTDKSTSKSSYYIVKKGDTLSKIAQKTHSPLKTIMALNHVNSKNLRVGQKLILAKSSITQEKSASDMADEDMEEDNDLPDMENENNVPYANNSSFLTESDGNRVLLGKWNNPDEAQLLVKVATGFIGAPYRFGGSSLKGIDCSSFVQKIYGIFDVSLPRNAREQSKVGISITRENLTKGDLVFFHTNRSLGHVGIYIGNNEFVHASSKSKAVRIDSLDTPYYQKRFQQAVRVKGQDG